MLREKLDSLNDGGILKKGILFSVFFLAAMLFSMETTGFRPSFVIIFLAASAAITVWSSKCYSLMKDTDILFAPIFIVCASFYAAVLPLTQDEIPVADVLSYGDGATFSRIFSLPSFWLLKSFGASIEASAYFARFVNLICCGFLLWFAVRSIPYCKALSASVALLPSALRSMATAAPQGTTLATSMLFIALVIRAAYTRDDYVMGRKYLFALTVSTLLMLFCNISTLPFISLLLMIPADRFGARKRFLSFFAIIAAFVVVCLALWTFGAAEAVLAPLEDLSRAAQFSYILSHPFYYLTVLLRTIFSEGLRIFSEIFVAIPVTYTAGNEIMLPWVLPAAFMVCLMFTAYFDSGLSPRLEKIIRSTGISTLVFLAVQLTFYYMARTPVGNDIILGIDGGVLLPVFLPACLLVKRLCRHPAAPQKNFTEALMVLGIANIATALFICYSL